jgi:prepilin-type N-terminal cleavage/methylation domain-containing protein
MKRRSGKRFFVVRKVFTLIELVVVIAIIALLMAILMPALQRARRQAAGSVCMANIKSISGAWFAYQLDNDGAVCSYVYPGQDTPWVQMPQDKAGNKTWPRGGPECPLEDKIRGIERGLFFPYVGKSYKAFHCPLDHRKDFGVGFSPFQDARLSRGIPSTLPAAGCPRRKRGFGPGSRERLSVQSL